MQVRKRCLTDRLIGFTLLEMAIVLTIIGMVMAATLFVGNPMIKLSQQMETNNKLDAIETALMAYRVANNRLPCPADPTLTDISANAAIYGTEAGTPGYCTTSPDANNPNIATYTVPTHSNSGSPAYTPITTNLAALGMSVAEGAVPVKTLGLPDEFQFDGWGRKFAYAVATPMTYEPTVTNSSAAYVNHIPPAITAGSNRPAFINYGTQGNCGAITVQNAAHNNRTQVADYVLLSFGPDGHGGYNKAGTRYLAGSDNADEWTNCHCNATTDTGNYTATYIQQGPTQTLSTDSLSMFDDIVRYKERWQLQNNYDTYHPGSYLPCTNGFVVQGAAGTSLAVGDINGDGIPDLIIGAPSANSGAGKVYVVFGTRQGFPDPLPLSSLNGTNGFELDGVTPGDQVGTAVATGDINGDGYADIVIGAISANSNKGYTYVVFGKGGPWATPQTLNIGAGQLIDGTQGVRFDGVVVEQIGYSLATGDVNGDGYADVIIGAFNANKINGNYIGDTYVVFGKSASWGAAGNVLLNTGSGNVIDGTHGIRFDGTSAVWLLYEVAAGDFNGDGYADVITGGVSEPGGAVAVAYVVLGKSTTTTGFLPSTTVTTANGSTALTNVGSYNGLMVGQALTASGIPANDYIASCNIPSVATFGTLCASSIQLKNNATGTSTTLTVASEPLAIGPGTLIDGTKGVRFDRAAGPSGENIMTTGDINGDGYADIIIGDPYENPLVPGNAATYMGYTYVVFGKSTPWPGVGNVVLNLGPGNLLDGTHGVRFDGVGDGDMSGSSVATGDVNGDGIADLMIGAPPAPSLTYDGSNYVVFGKTATWGTAGNILLSTGPGNLIDGTHGSRLDGPAGTSAGASVITGDVNGDGIPDIITASPSSGYIYIYNGRASGWPATPYGLGGL